MARSEVSAGLVWLSSLAGPRDAFYLVARVSINNASRLKEGVVTLTDTYLSSNSGDNQNSFFCTLVVIAILAIVAFRDKVSSLWEAISQGINSL